MIHVFELRIRVIDIERLIEDGHIHVDVLRTPIVGRVITVIRNVAQAELEEADRGTAGLGWIGIWLDNVGAKTLTTALSQI